MLLSVYIHILFKLYGYMTYTLWAVFIDQIKNHLSIYHIYVGHIPHTNIAYDNQTPQLNKERHRKSKYMQLLEKTI